MWFRAILVGLALGPKGKTRKNLSGLALFCARSRSYNPRGFWGHACGEHTIMEHGFGIIGCGMIAKFHAKAIADQSSARLVACFDNIPAAADRLAGETGCQAYHRLEDMLADPRVTVVTIGTPSGAHLEPALAAARAGKHVIVEKPLEITLDRCDQIIRACEENKVKVSAIFPSRFHHSSQTIKRAID